MKVYGLIGYPLAHSFSALYFNEKFMAYGLEDCQYLNFPISDIDQFPALLVRQPALHGLNVTVPYKKAIIPFLDELSEDAEVIGAVNVICVTKNGLRGCNTDWLGFRDSLRLHLDERKSDLSALILGTGGSASAVRYALQHLGIPSLSVSRTRSGTDIITYSELSARDIARHQLIVQTTPLGMYPDVETCPEIDFAEITSEHLLYDLIYNPAETKFLRKGRLQGARTVNGAEMLRLQAEFGWMLWQGEGEGEG
jgi:shikimate dehydrogenase